MTQENETVNKESFIQYLENQTIEQDREIVRAYTAWQDAVVNLQAILRVISLKPVMDPTEIDCIGFTALAATVERTREQYRQAHKSALLWRKHLDNARLA